MSKDYKNWSKENLIDEIQKLKKRKKYGLVWDENEKENVVLKCKNQFPILKEIKDKELKFKDVDVNNIIIEGDNYHSLSILNYTHNNSVDIIYIDPPYNSEKTAKDGNNSNKEHANSSFIYKNKFGRTG